MRECPNCKEKISYKELLMSSTSFPIYSYIKCDHCNTKYKTNKTRRNILYGLNFSGIIACSLFGNFKILLLLIPFFLISPLFMSSDLSPYPTTK